MNRHLPLDKAFLDKNEIDIKDKVVNKGTLKDELTTLIKQTPTNRLRRWVFYESTGRFQKRFGEDPTLYNEEEANKTAESIKFYLQNKGYYDANVQFSKKIKYQHAKVNYVVTLNKPYLINELSYRSYDENILKIIESVREESFLKKGVRLDVKLYNAEVNRLTKVVRNFGYANFYGNYFSTLDADTSNFSANVIMEIFSPNDTTHHRKYKIRNIQVLTEYVTLLPNTKKDTLIDGIKFTAPSGEFALKINYLYNCVPIRKGDLFRQENLDLMYSRFEQMKSFRLINIKQSFPTGSSNEVDIVVTLAQIGKYSLETNAELNYTNGGTRSNAIGLSASGGIRNNNVFKGGERYSGNLEGGVQGLLQGKDQQFWDIKFQNDYYVPKLYDMYGLWKGMNRFTFGKLNDKIDVKYRKIVNDEFYNHLKDQAQTKYSLGFNYIKTFGLEYLLFNMNYGYVLSRSNNKKIIFNHTSLEWLKPITLSNAILTSEFQRRRFSEQFVTSLIFKNINIAKQLKSNENNTTQTLRYGFEQSGLELFGVNKLYNSFSKKDSTAFHIFGTDYTRYLKGEVEYTFGKKINNTHSLHFRGIAGAATPFGFNTVVPFVKQFFVGGPSSLRAWRIRELGPGGFRDTSTNTKLFYQTGDLKLELNAEYRFPIYWIFKGAFFVDAGNVWLVKKNKELPNAQFSTNFYKQIAIGSGMGLRIDFDYGVIRFDFAYKIRNPYPDSVTGKYFAVKDLSSFRPKNLNWAVALDYPF